MHDYRELSRLMERTLHKYIQLEKKPHTYDHGIVLTQAEIHTIAAVGDNPGINITELARQRGITKGAASQMIYKLVDKGYIDKRISPNSDTEVYIDLTDTGKIAYRSHMKYHDDNGVTFFRQLQDMPEEYQDYTLELLKEFDRMLDDKLR